MSGPRILIADTPEAIDVLRQALATSHALQSVTTLEHARQALAERPSLVICGCHFDEGRMYDLLRHLKATQPLADLPFLAVRCLQGELEDTLYESVKIAVRALGGNAFVDLLRWQRKYGPAEAGHRLTLLVESLARWRGADSE